MEYFGSFILIYRKLSLSLAQGLGVYLFSVVIWSSFCSVQAGEEGVERLPLLSIPLPTTTVGSGVVMSESSSPAGKEWSSAYRLGYGDFLDIRVLGADEYGAEVVVGQDGTVNLPQIGQVSVRGLTLPQATEAIATQYAIFIREPIVNVQPLRLRPVHIGIAGEIKRPGSYVLTGVNDFSSSDIRDFGFPTLTQAIE